MKKDESFTLDYLKHKKVHKDTELRKLVLEGFRTKGIVGSFFIMTDGKKKILYDITNDTYKPLD